jgi:endonuclease/exonuclease/phosphatase (EEP) superfamily protein YafD
VRHVVKALSLVPIALTLLPFVKTGKWWVRIWDYPRQQLAGILALTFWLDARALPPGRPRRVLLTATLAALAWQLIEIRPYTRAARVQSLPAGPHDRARSVSILMANVRQGNRRISSFLAHVEAMDPDIVLALETDAWWDEGLSVLRARYPFVVRHPLENTYGLHLFSKLELSDVVVQDRVTRDVPSVSARVRLRSGDVVRLYGLHPEPPQVGNDVHERDAELLLVAREVADDSSDVILFGDLNDVAWSHTTRLFQRISGLLDPRVGRGLFPTFHAGVPLARWPLDHIFHGAAFRLARLAVLDDFGSDHFPVYVELVFDPAAVRVHEVPTPGRGDAREATDKIAEGLSR